MKNNELVTSVFGKLPSFYREHIYDPTFIKELFDCYAEVINILNTYAKYLYNASSLTTISKYKIIDKKILILSTSLYNILNTAAEFQTSTGSDWFTTATSVADKIAYLEALSKNDDLFLYGLDNTVLTDEVISMSIKKDFSQELSSYINLRDFYIRENKLYIFNDLAKPPVRGAVKKVLATDLVVKNNKLDNKYGIFYPNIYSEYSTSDEYKNMLQTLITSDFKVSAIQRVLENLNLSETSMSIRDTYTKKNLPVSYLTTPETLYPFEFVYTLPASMLEALYYIPGLELTSPPIPYNENLLDDNYVSSYSDEDLSRIVGKIINIRNFLFLIKPTYAEYLIQGTMRITDRYAPHYSDSLDVGYEGPGLSASYANIFDKDAASFAIGLNLISVEGAVESNPDFYWVESENDQLIKYDVVAYDAATYDGPSPRSTAAFDLVTP